MFRHGASASSRQLYTHLNSKIFVCLAMERASGSVKKLDKKALEGLDARTESTKVPEEDLMEVDEEADPPSENETQTSSKTREEADRLPVEELLEMMTKYRKGNSMLSEFMLQQLEENQKEDLLGRLFTEHMETPQMKLPEITEEQIRRANQVLLATMEKCPFCKKVLDEVHVNNKNHLTYMKEHLQSHHMLDPGFEMTTEEVK